ncbi:MAG: phosphoadenosine phosphosulfate reductase family protein [Desulfurococcaceae archaeon]
MHSLIWLTKQNVPVILRSSGKGWKVRSDVWLAGRYEKEVLSSTIHGLSGVKVELDKRHIVFHRVPAWESKVEYAVEVFGEASRLGILYYGTDNKWHIIPSGALASILIGLGAEATDIAGKRDEHWLKNKRVELGRGCRGREYVLISTEKYAGVGKVLDADRCVVKVKDLVVRGFKLLAEPSPGDLVELNKATIEEAAEEAKGFIRRIYEKYVAPGKIHVSFSGGADSTAVLLLAVEELGAEKVVAAYSDTGLEYPETQEYVKKISSKLGVELLVLEPKTAFLEEIRKRGLMSVENRWCTLLLKLYPLKKLYENRGVRLYLDGARDYESALRARTRRIAENPALPRVYRALPIKSWPRLLVQLYLHSREVELNPLYDKGLSRIGCIVCPAMHKYELALSYSLYRNLHEEIIKACGFNVEEYLSMGWSGRRLFAAKQTA